MNLQEEVSRLTVENEELRSRAMKYAREAGYYEAQCRSLTKVRAQISKVMGPVHEEAVREISDLRAALRNLLLSADSMWEERRMGHDWAEAMQAARKALGMEEDHDS